ncbi:MAG: hypothetical protein E7584_02090 [Ruminococcaceae bacterium]|nr:hypothetical protein [Oscillospiraceae bacterium]
MKRNIGRIIEIAILIAGILLTAAIVVAIPLKSYNEYKAYRENLIELSKPEPKPVLESLTVQLKEGVKYFKNDLAEPKAEDFLVMANYTLEGVSYSEEIEAGKFSIATNPDFYVVGGDVKVTYKGKTETYNIELIPVKIESLSITQNPYTVKYQTGSTFDANGLIISAVYNDGSTKVIPTDKYVIDAEKILVTGDSFVSVSYSEENETRVVEVPIGVVDVLDNGAVTKLIVTSDATVEAGSKLSTAQMEINAVYESGNRLPLDKSKYVVSGSDTVVKFGKAYNVSISYIDNPEVSVSTGVIVRSTLQGEKATIVGGKTGGASEYAVVDGVIKNLGSNVSYAGDFGKSVKNGQEGSLTFTITSESAVIGNITMRAGNSYCCFVNGKDDKDGHIMKPLQVNTILDLIINGQVVEVPDSVVLKGSGPHGDYNALYNIYYEFTFENIALDPGENKIKIKFKNSTNGALTRWGESPSTMNIDYIKVDTVGNEIPDDFVIDKIEIASCNVEINQRFDRIKPTVYAVLANGTKVMVSQDLFDFSVTGGEEGATRITYGKYTITASLKSNPEVKATKEFESIGVKVLNVSVEQEGDKVYYVFSGTYYGCTAEDLQFFDGTKTYDLITEFTDTTVTFKIDVTLLPAGITIWPHLKIRGVNYYNGGQNENGDILGNDLGFIDNQSVTFNGQVYKIVRASSMPTLQISKAE